jgi:hypothetical protein
MAKHRPVVPEVCSQGIRGYISLVDTLRFAYFCNYRNNVLLKITMKIFQFAVTLFHTTTEIYNNKLHVPTSRATVCPKSVLRYKF